MWQAHVIKLSQEMQPRVAIHIYCKMIQGCSDTVLSLSHSSSPPLDKPPLYYEVKQLSSQSEAVSSLEDSLSQHQYLKAVQILRALLASSGRERRSLARWKRKTMSTACSSFMQDISQIGKKVRHEMVRKCFMTYHLVTGLIGFVIYFVCVFV